MLLARKNAPGHPSFFLGWQTWAENAFFKLVKVTLGVVAEAALLAAALPTLVQVGSQTPPILDIPRPQVQPFLWAQPRGQTRHHAHRPLHHQTRRCLFTSAG